MTTQRTVLCVSLLGIAVLIPPLFSAPAHADEPSPEAIRADLPFLDALPNQVKIDLGTPGGRGLALLLDTGALQSFSTAGAARDLGISLRRDKQTPYRRATRLGVPLDLYVDTRRGDTGRARGGDYALVGAPFLARFVVEIDFPRRRVRFLDPDAYEVPPSAREASVLPLRPGSALPVVEIRVGETRVPAVIATGVPGTLILPGGWAAAETSAVTLDADATDRLDLPPGGESMFAAIAKRIRLAELEEQDVPLLVAPEGLWDRGPRSEALLGVDFLKRFVVRLDLTRKRLWIRDPSLGAREAPGPEPVSAPRRRQPGARVAGIG
jgi:hypothetical protein